MALPVPTKSLLRTSSDAAMLFAPPGAPTHVPPPHVPPFLLTHAQNRSPKDIAGSDIMKLKGYICYGLRPKELNYTARSGSTSCCCKKITS